MFQNREHHIRGEVCTNRPPYRDGRKQRAVKVYTIAQESKYLLVQNVPAIGGVLEQLLPIFIKFGNVEQHWPLHGYTPNDDDDDDETVLIKFKNIQQARIAKCRLDDYNFMGKNLHICYASESESFDDLKEKIAERRSIVKWKNERNQKSKKKISSIESLEKTTNEIRKRMREAVQKSNFISVVLQEPLKKKMKKN